MWPPPPLLSPPSLHAALCLSLSLFPIPSFLARDGSFQRRRAQVSPRSLVNPVTLFHTRLSPAPSLTLLLSSPLIPHSSPGCQTTASRFLS